MENTIIRTKDTTLVQASRVVGEDGKVNVALLSEEDRTRCRELTRGITNIDSLLSFGSDIAQSKNEAAEKLLDINKISKADKVGEYVSDVVNAIKESEYQDPSKMTGIRGFIAKYIPFGTSLVKAGDKHILAKFETSKSVVNKIVSALEEQQVDLKSDYNTLSIMLEKTKSYIDQLGVHYVALAQLYQDKRTELEDMVRTNNEKPGTYSPQEIDEARVFLDKIDRHGYELFLAGQYHQNIIIPNINKMKDNALDLCENAKRISHEVIPNWEMNVTMALINKNEQAAANLQKMIKDKNNEMMIANAEMLANVTLTLEQENRRGAYDIESYRKAYSITIDALKKSEESMKVAKAERAENMKKIIEINRENSKELHKIAENMKKFYDDDLGVVTSDALK